MFSRTFALAVGLLFATSTLVAFSGHGHHRHHQPVCCCCCEAPATCQVKVCRAKVETGKVSKTKYSCECKEFCIPGRSTLCGTECDCESGCSKCKKIWKPGCGQVRTRLVLKKSTEEVEVVKYSWEVVDACGDCSAKLEEESAKNEEKQKKEEGKKDQKKTDEKKSKQQDGDKKKDEGNKKDATGKNGDAAESKQPAADQERPEPKQDPSARASGRRRGQATRASSRAAAMLNWSR